MKITYNENPLAATVELDAHDIEILRLKVKIDMLEDKIVDAHCYLKEPMFNIDKAKAAVDLRFLDEPEKTDAEVERTLTYLKEALVEEHAGDCVCYPCTCTKCMAEERLGIDTLGGAGKHTLNKVGHVFSQPGVLTCDDAIAWLESHEVEIPEAKMLPYFEGWKQTRLKAIEYLKNYSLTHLKG